MRLKRLLVILGIALPLLFLVMSWKVEEPFFEDVPVTNRAIPEAKEIPAKAVAYEVTDDSITILKYLYLKHFTPAEYVSGKGGGAWAIPAQIEGLPVTRIGADAFSSEKMSHITVPNSVVIIERRAFQFMDNLRSIVIGANVERIGTAVFFYSKLGPVIFLGDAPEVQGEFPERAYVYRKPDAKGWGDTFAGRPVKLISDETLIQRGLLPTTLDP